MSRTINARGLSCPVPLIMVTRAMQEGGSFEIIVDNPVSRENILRLLGDRYGLVPETSGTGGEYRITVRREK